MPQVRVYERTQSTQALQGGQLTAAETEISTGAGVSRARQQKLERIGEVADKAVAFGTQIVARQEDTKRQEAEEARQFANNMAVIDAQNKMDAWRRDAIYDPQNGALTKKGKDAFGLPEQVDSDFEKMASDLGATMVTPEQKLGFARAAAQMRQQVQLETRRHVDREMQTYTAEETKARVANGIAQTIRTSTAPDKDGHVDPSRGLAELNAVVDDFKSVAPQMGLTPGQIEEQERDIRTKAHEGTIRALLADNKPQAAKVYFEEVSSQVDPERHDEIKAMLKTGSVRADAQKETDRIVSDPKLTTLEQQRAEAKKISDPEVQDEVLSRIEHENAVKKQQEQQAREDSSIRVGNILDKTRSVTAIPPDVWTKMTMGQKEAARNYVKDLVEHGQPKTDNAFMYSLYEQAQNDPQGFAQRNLADVTVMGKLSKADWEQMVTLQRNVRNGNKKAAEEGLEGYQTSTQIVDSILSSAGFDTTPKPGSKEAATVTALRTAVDQEVASLKAEKAAKGQKISSEDIRAITDTMMKKVVTQKGSGKIADIFTFSGHYSDVEKRIGEVTIDDIAPSDQAGIRDALLRKGRVPTEAEIVRVYRLGLASQAAKKPNATTSSTPATPTGGTTAPATRGGVAGTLDTK